MKVFSITIRFDLSTGRLQSSYMDRNARCSMIWKCFHNFITLWYKLLNMIISDCRLGAHQCQSSSNNQLTGCHTQRGTARVERQAQNRWTEMHKTCKTVMKWPQPHTLEWFNATLQWRHNERAGVSNHQPHDCLLNRLFKAQIKENIKASRHWPLCGEFTGHRRILRTKGQ